MSDFFEEFEKFCEDYKSWRREGISESESFDIDEDEEVLEFISDYNEPLFPFDEDEENMGEDNLDNEIDKLNDLKERFDFLKINSNDSSFSTNLGTLYDEDIISYSKMNFYNNVLNFIFSNLEIKTLNDFVDCFYNSLEFVIIDDKKKFKECGRLKMIKRKYLLV